MARLLPLPMTNAIVRTAYAGHRSSPFAGPRAGVQNVRMPMHGQQRRLPSEAARVDRDESFVAAALWGSEPGQRSDGSGGDPDLRRPPASLGCPTMTHRAPIGRDLRDADRLVEVEARFSVSGDVLARLQAHGLIFSDPVIQDDQAYAPAHWSWGDDRIGVPFARLRTQLGRHLFTVKRPITDVRTCIERECEVTDRAAMHDALELMGFTPTVQIVKTRRTAERDNLSFCFDEVERVGTFVEIEALASEADDLDAIRERVERLLESMGVPAERCTSSYDTLVYEATASATRQETVMAA